MLDRKQSRNHRGCFFALHGFKRTTKSVNIKINKGESISFSTTAEKGSLLIPFKNKESIKNIRINIIQSDKNTVFAEIIFKVYTSKLENVFALKGLCFL